MKINKGNSNLIKKKDWIKAEQLHGNDEDILCSTLMNKAQEAILEKFVPKSKVALISLCSATRPYSKSRKWKTFIKEFNGVDFIISSNGGIVPMEYENEYPYLTYDAHGTKEFDKVYQIFTARSLVRFFVLKKYDYLIFNFRPTLRNKWSGKFAGDYLKNKGHIKDYCISPSIKTYNKAKVDGFKKRGISMYPDIHPIIMNELNYFIKLFSK